MITYHDTPMHGVRLNVPTADGRLIENVYEVWTDRVYYLFGRLPVWFRAIDVERRPLHEFIGKCFP